MTKNVLLVCPTQYGYNTDFLKYSECLADTYNVYYVGLELNYKKRFESDRVNIVLVEHDRYFCGIFSLLVTSIKLSRRVQFSNVIIYYSLLCSLFMIVFGRAHTIVDIRTAYIGGSMKSKILNWMLRHETNLFKTITVISEGVADFLKLNRKKCRILPLGADAGVYAAKNNPPQLL